MLGHIEFSPLSRAFLTAAVLAAPGQAAAQQVPGAGEIRASAPATPRNEEPVYAVRISEPITLDGQLNESVWQLATPATALRQVEPDEGQPVSERSEIRILFDDDFLYVGAYYHDRYPVTTHLARRDAVMFDSDKTTIAFDTYRDGLTAYRFHANPAGVRRETRLSGGQLTGGDATWDPVWDLRTTVTDSSWVVEMKIPFSQIPFAEAPEQVWGVQMERFIARRQEDAWLAFIAKSEPQTLSRFRELRGLTGVRRGRGFEILPYVTARADYMPLDQAANAGFPNPYRDRANYLGEVGIDVKYRLASNLTLDATVNPDFGQVEVDPAVVNLTAFETRFTENRPFFVAGSEVFQFGGSGAVGGGSAAQLLYTRRIGGPLAWRPPSSALYADVPEEATILEAGKLTGRTAGGWNVGVIEAVTSRETARYVDADASRHDAVGAPLTGYFVGRTQKTFRQGGSSFGGIATAVRRRSGDVVLADQLRSSAYVAGVDFSHQFLRRNWVIAGFAAGSRIAGRTAAITDAQRSSARYYNRPDADHLDLDPNATSLSGYNASIDLRKQAGLHWRGNAGMTLTSPGYEVNDLGFQRDADRIATVGQLRYQETRLGTRLRNWSSSVQFDRSWNYGMELVGSSLSGTVNAQHLSFWSLGLNAARDFEAYNDRLTRGGPLALTPAGWRAGGNFSSDRRQRWTVGGSGAWAWNGVGGRMVSLGTTFTFRPKDTWAIEIGPSYSRERSEAQYIGSVADATATQTFGRRYLFSGLDQSTVLLNTRLNITFKPDMTLEFYGQPFVASADFEGIRELRDPGAFAFLRYGKEAGTVEREGNRLSVDPDGAGPAPRFRIGEGDFNRRSLKGNAVLRWEWRAGSTLFLVWQHQRTASEELNDLRLSRDLDRLFASPSRNIFAIKASYWLSP